MIPSYLSIYLYYLYYLSILSIYTILSQAEGDASGAWSSTPGSRALQATTVTKRNLTPLGLYRFRVRGLHGIDGGGGEPGPFSAPSSLVRCGAPEGRGAQETQRAEALKSAVSAALLLEERLRRARRGARAEEAGEPELGEGDVEEEDESEEEGEEFDPSPHTSNSSFSLNEGDDDGGNDSSTAPAISC